MKWAVRIKKYWFIGQIFGAKYALLYHKRPIGLKLRVKFNFGIFGAFEKAIVICFDQAISPHAADF